MTEGRKGSRKARGISEGRKKGGNKKEGRNPLPSPAINSWLRPCLCHYTVQLETA